jgi:hypothetical protein
MRATKPLAADLDRTFGELSRLVSRYRDELRNFAAGGRGPVREELADSLRGMADHAGEELLSLAAIHGRG